MYIYIDESINNIDISTPDILCKVEFLLNGFSEGNYILSSSSRGLLRKFSENIDLSRNAAPLLKYAERIFSRPAYIEALTPSEKVMRR